MAASNNYWLGLGPITKAENDQAFKYLSKRNLPTDKNSLRQRVAKMRKRRDLNRYLRGKEQAGTDPNTPWQLVFGQCDIGGTITFIHTSGPADQKDLYLHMIITLAAHEINYIDYVYFNNVAMTWDTSLTSRPTGLVLGTGTFAGLVKMQINYGSDSQSALSVPVGDSSDALNPVSAKWTSDHRQRGHAHVYFRFKWSPTVFKDGVPDITFRVNGPYNMNDPRTDTNVPGAQNAAIVLYNYMRNTRWGLGLADSDFNSTRMDQAVNDCEDSISLAGGGTENRYLINTHFGADASPGVVIEDMLAAMHGRLAYVEGKFSLIVGKARPSTVMTITADMILSDIDLVTKTPRADNFNAVRGTFVSTINNQEESDFPSVRNSTYVTEDGGTVIYEDLTYTMVRSAATAQRLAKIELEATRQGILVEFTARMDVYQAEPGEWVAVTYSRVGWSAKVFEVLRSALLIEQDSTGNPYFAVRLTLQETASGVYDWNSGNETTFDVAPNTNLPDPYSVSDPTGLSLASGTDHLYIRQDGTVFARLYATWTASSDAFVVNGGRYEIQHKKSADSDWQNDTPVAGGSTNTYILDVQDGQNYDVRIRAVSAMNAFGSWVTVTGHTVIGKTAAPSTVSSLTAVIDGFGLKFTWTPVTDLDVRQYEIRYGVSTSTWDQCALVVRTGGTSYFADSFVAGTYAFRIKALDTTGNYSVDAASTLLTIDPPSIVQNLSIGQIDSTLLLRWQVPATTTFPIAYYRVIRQDSVSILDLGTVTGTFATYVELISGAYTYRVSAVDIAGNEGAAASSSVTVYNPPDFVLRSSQSVTLSGATLANALYTAESFSVEATVNTDETWDDHFTGNGYDQVQDFIDFGYTYWLEPLTGGTGTATFTTTAPSIWAPLSTTETWDDHFINNGVTTIQGLIDAGFANWLLPNSLLTGTISATVDFGEVLPQSVVQFDYISFGSGINPVPMVSWKKLIGDPWIDGQVGSRKATPSNFQYLKLTLTVAPQTNLDWCVVTDVTATLQVKEVSDSGTTAVNAADSGGTTITFNTSFLDVSSIVASPQGTVEIKEVVNFTDVPNPTSFKVLLFDAAGARVSGTVRWTARGVQSVI
jgi:hypothetical protein